jgi:hypothetical protein
VRTCGTDQAVLGVGRSTLHGLASLGFPPALTPSFTIRKGRATSAIRSCPKNWKPSDAPSPRAWMPGDPGMLGEIKQVDLATLVRGSEGWSFQKSSRGVTSGASLYPMSVYRKALRSTVGLCELRKHAASLDEGQDGLSLAAMFVTLPKK